MNWKNFLKSLTKVLMVTSAVLLISFLARSQFNDIFLLDEPSIGWYWGVFGTLYALVTTFILVTVWEQFQDFDNSLSTEAKSLSSIWNYTNYLNDDKISVQMRKTLIEYADCVLKKEIIKLKKGERVQQNSKELKFIMKVIDKISFDDKRDPEAFQAMIKAYEDLVETRKTRIGLSMVRIPPHLNAFSNIISVSFVFSYMLHGFNDAVLYYLTLGVLTIVVYMSYIIIHDFDDYFVGIWNVSFDALKDTRKFIKTDKHE